MTDRIMLARDTAADFHRHQKRRYTDEPYLNHLENVATLVQEHGGSENDIIVAILHDSVEDTPMTFTLLQKLFGDDVATGVWWLTDTHRDLGNRNTRKLLDRTRLAAAPPNIQSIKLCDLIDNTSTIMKHDPEFGERYLGEKLQLLHIMNRGNNRLWERTHNLIREQPFYHNPDWLTKYDPTWSVSQN